MTNDNKQKLYNALSRDYELGTFEKFCTDIDDSVKRRKLFDAASQDYELGSWESFSKQLGYTDAPQETSLISSIVRKVAEQAKRHVSVASEADGSDVADNRIGLPNDGQAAHNGAQVDDGKGQQSWTPSVQDRVRASYQMQTVADELSHRVDEGAAKVARINEPLTSEGRQHRKQKEMEAQMAGAHTTLLGLTGPSKEKADEGKSSTSTEKVELRPDAMSPVPYGVEYVDGKAVTKWLMPDGSLTTNFADADAAEFAARQERLHDTYLKNTKDISLDIPKGKSIRVGVSESYGRPVIIWRLPDGSLKKGYATPDDEKFIKENQEKFDEFGGNLVSYKFNQEAAVTVQPKTKQAAEQAWKAAEAAFGEKMERNRRNADILLSSAGNSSDAAAIKQLETIDNFTDRLTTHDLDALMDAAWSNLGEAGQKSLIDDCYKILQRQNPESDKIALYNLAKDYARQQSDKSLYNLAVEKNMPKNGLDYFMRKISDMNLVTNLGKGIAVNRVGKTGDMAAYEAANEQYRQDGHKILDVAGMATGFVFDPTAVLSAGVGGAATRGAMWAGGRFLAGRGASAAVKQAATRQFANTMTGRLVGGVAGHGAVNFGTFEGIKELENQFAHGGHIVGQDETGRYINEGYSASAVGGQVLHGFGMGAAIGWLGPVTGNVSDKLVRATSSTLGKVATRAGIYTGATIAEGTIFSIPEWIEGGRDGFDVWTDNMAMMFGFKAKHMVKSAGGILRDLKASFESPTNGSKNRLDFESCLRQRMDAPSDGGLALTKDEQAELQRYGYNLRELVESAERTGNAKEGGIIAQNAPEIVSRLTDMVTDPRVSEAARAKMYYYATGRKLPMSTVMRGELFEDGNGGFVVESLGANGVITSRSFTNRKAADLELERIRRQSELNQLELGERYQPIADFESRMMEASRRVAANHGWNPVDVYKTCEDVLDSYVRGNNKELSDVQKNIYSKILAELDKIEVSDLATEKRTRINAKYDVDIDKAIRKEPNRRTEAEQKAIDEYIAELMPRRNRGNGMFDEAGRRLLPEEGAPRDVEAVNYREVDENGQTIDPRFEDGFVGGEPHKSAEQPIGRAVMKYQDREVEVLSGRVVMTDDGTMVDKRRSDRSIVIRDVATGKVEMVAPEAILSYEGYADEGELLDAPISPESPSVGESTGTVSAAPVYDLYDTFSVNIEGRDRPLQAAVVEREGDTITIWTPEAVNQASAKSRTMHGYLTDFERAELDEMLTRDEQGAPVGYVSADREQDSKGVETDINSIDKHGNNEQNSVNLQYGNRPEQDNDERTQSWKDDGGRVVDDATRSVEADRDRSDIRMYEEGLGTSYNEYTEYSERDRREAESQRLVNVARQNGQYKERSEIHRLGERREKPSGESEVVINKENGRVYKIKDPFAKSPMKGNVQPEDAIYEHLVHNKYFPETRYQFEGVSDEAGDLRIVLSQGYVESVGQPTKEQIETALAEKGLHPDGKYSYGNEEITVTDVTGDNALLGADGKVYFIDPIIDFKKPVREILGDNTTVQSTPTDASSPEEQVIRSGIGEPVKVSEAPQTALSRVPLNDKGNPDFRKAEPEVAWDALVEKTNNEGTAQGFADNMVKRSEEALKKAEKIKLPSTDDIDEFIAADKNRQSEIDAAKATLEHWKQIAGINASRQKARQEAEAERLKAEREAQAELERQENEAENAWREQRRKLDNKVRETADVMREVPEAVEILGNTDPQDIYEAAALVLSTNKILAKDSGVRRGYRSLTGGGAGEQRKLFGLFARAENGGKSMESLAEDEMQQICETYGIPYDNADAMNALIEVVRQSNTMGDIRNYITNNRIRQANEYYDQWVEQMKANEEQMYLERYHMSKADYEAYVESLEAEYAWIDEETLRAVDNMFAEYSVNEINDRNYERENERTAAVGIRSAEVLSGSPSDFIRRGEAIEAGKSGTVRGEGGREHDVAPESTSAQRGIAGRGTPDTDIAVLGGGEPPESGAGAAGDSRGGNLGNGRKSEAERLTKETASGIIAEMEQRATAAPELELTIENWDAQFGENGIVSTPIGDVKMGENQFTKLMRQGRNGKLGMIKPTLETPDIIIEDASKAKDADATERDSSYVFVKTFVKPDGSRYYYFTSVTVSKEGHEVVVSNQEKRRNVLTNLLMKGKLVWKHADDVSSASDVADGLFSTQGNLSDPIIEGTDAPQTNSVSSERKVTNSASEKQESGNVKQTIQEILVSDNYRAVVDTDSSGKETYIVLLNKGARKKEWQIKSELHNGHYSSDGYGTLIFSSRNDMEACLDDRDADIDILNKRLLRKADENRRKKRTEWKDSMLEKIKGMSTEDLRHNIELYDKAPDRRHDEEKEVIDAARQELRLRDAAVKESTDDSAEITRLSKKYRSAPIKVVKSIEDIKSDDLSEDTLEEIAGAMEEAETQAIYCKENKKIYIFAGKYQDGELDYIVAHESVHAAVDKLGLRNREELNYYRKSIAGIFDNEAPAELNKIISEKYAPEDEDEEFLAYTLPWISRNKKRMRRVLENGDGRLIDLVNQLNEEIYGKEEIQSMLSATEERTSTNVHGGRGGQARGRRGTAGIVTGDNSGGDADNGNRQIEDFGEKIAGARKDALSAFAKTMENVSVQSLIELPISKAFTRPNLRKMVEAGAISDEDAILAEAILQGQIYAHRKPALTKRQSSKRAIEEWARATYAGISMLGEILSGDPSRREAAILQYNERLAKELEAANAHVAKMREWNPGKKIEDVKAIPNPIDITRRVLEGIGYHVGDAVKLPLTNIELSSNKQYYIVGSAGKQGALWFKMHHDTLDGAVDTMIMAAKLARGDRDVELPLRQFVTKGVGTPHKELTGKYEVLYFAKDGKTVKSRVFDGKDKAEVFAADSKGSMRELVKYTNDFDAYAIEAINPLTGERHTLRDDFGRRAEASTWIDESYEEANNLALDALYKEMNVESTPRSHYYVESVFRHGKMVGRVVEDDKKNPWRFTKYFESRKEADEWLAANAERLEAERKAHLDQKRKVVYFENTNGERHGVDYRGGEDATPEMFSETFGFRGVQFGNWTNNADRQAALNQTYDALMDLSNELGITPRAVSLDGELGLAFGARGTGGATAHYEPVEVVINLTKTKGAGALAHEWWHAVDNFLSRKAGVAMGYATARNGLEGMRPEIREAVTELMDALDNSAYARRSRDKGDYWGRPTELGARLFAAWLAERMKERGVESPFLTTGLSEAACDMSQRFNYIMYEMRERDKAEIENREPDIMSREEFNKLPESLHGYPYPTAQEIEDFGGHLSTLFGAMSEREKQSGSIANERGGRYKKLRSTTAGMSLFDWADAEEIRHRQSKSADEKALTAEVANNALDEYAEAYNNYLDRWEDLERHKAEVDKDSMEAQGLQEAIEQEERMAVEARERLIEALSDYYLRDNTPEDTRRIARDMAARVQAEVEIRRDRSHVLSDILPGGDVVDPIGRKPEQAEAKQVKTAGGNISYNALGHLPDAKAGEFAYVERQFSRTGDFMFTGNGVIKDRGDVAYLFKALEDYSIEHVFAAFVKGGKVKVLHIGMGGPTSSFADLGAIRAGYDAFGADAVYLVHNHPSGNLSASVPDMRLMKTLEAAFGDEVAVGGIIIDTTSGRYTTFGSTGETGLYDMKQNGGEDAVDVMRFDGVDRSAGRSESVIIANSADIVRYVSERRLGEGDKISYLVLSNRNEIVGNFHTDYDKLDASGLAEEIASVTTKYGGTRAVVYGNVKINKARELSAEVSRLSLGAIKMLDAIEVTNGINRSANDEGLLYEPESELSNTQNGEKRYRELENNARLQEMAQTSAEAKRSYAERMSKKFNTPVRIVEDVKDVPAQFRNKKGAYDVKSGEIVVVIPNHANVEDVAETVFHEVVAHKGLREMIGEENYDAFCDEVYNHLKDDLKKQVDEETTRRFMNEPGKGYEHHRRVSVDELFGRMAEKGFEDFTKAERGVWTKLKAKVLEAINKFLGSLKLPKWVKLGDNELRYILWRSHGRLRTKGDYVDMARDAAKREELGLRRSDVIRERNTVKANIEDVNRRFNEELTRYQNGEMKPHEILHLGYPRGAMLNFLPKLPIVMRQRVIRKGSEKKHDVDVSAIMDMPSHLETPIFIFQRSEDTIGALTDMKDRTGKNVCVAIELKRQIQDGNAYLEVNDVRSFHGRDFKNIVEPIVNNQTLRWVDKSKGLAYLSSASQPVQQEIDRQVLEDATKIINSFENPTIAEEDSSEYRIREGETGDNVDMARDAAKREELGLTRGDALLVQKSNETTADKIEQSFNAAISGDLNGKPVEVGKLTTEGRTYLEKLSGVKMKEDVSFVLNPSDLVHIYRRHYGVNEKDMRNIPLTKEDIRQISEIVSTPDRIVYGKEISGNQRNMFFFLKEAQDGSYNLMEIYSDKKGNLTAKSFFKSKEGVSQRVMLLNESSTLTSVTDGATLSDGVKLPKFFENPTTAEEKSFEYRFRDGETGDIWKDHSVGLEERITNAAIRLSNNQSGDLNLRNDAQKAVIDNLQSLLHDMRNRQGIARSFAGADRKIEVRVVDAMNAQGMFDRTTVKRVSDLARILLQNGYLSEMTSGEIQRLLSAVKNATAMHDISDSVQKIMDIMVDNQLRNGEASLRHLLAIRGSKVDARGVEVQGVLDVEGQRTMAVVKDAISLTEDDITDRIDEALNRMSDPNQTIADDAAIEYAGLNMALDYVQNIANSKTEEKALRDELKRAKQDRDAGRMTDDAYKQFVGAAEDAIRKNKIERAEAYFNLVGRLSDSMRGSIENARAFREAEKARVNEIHHNANSDMEGRPANEHHKDDWKDKLINNGFFQFLFAPLGTFDQIMRVFGNKSANGEGYLWNRFMRGWVDCRNKELEGLRDKLAQLDGKAAELFGKGKTWGDIIRMERKLPKASVSFWDGGEMRDHKLTQGNLLYIYMVDKMTDGRMKLRRMGITEQDVADIENFLDPRFKALGDWLQDEFLVATRDEYNETHKRLFGASMAAIENYFPLKILANARIDKEEDVNQQNRPDGITTKTGSIIKRQVNNLALDITDADALSVTLDHIIRMEHWNAYAEWNRDLNTLRTYKRFRNQVINMTTVYGGGRTLWKKFNDLFLMAAGEYRPPVSNLNKSAVNIAKGVTAAKVSLRIFTALKQFLSAPAYAPEVSTSAIAKSIVNPYGDFKWCMENLPIFRERWQSRISGDPRLLKSDMDWKMWRSRIMELSSRIGMTPNAFVDAVTVSIGAKAMYETRLKQYLKEGYSKDAAEKRAKQDATILFNQTQQSSESPFLSTMQVDKDWLSTMLTVFRNSSMSYTRQTYDAARNLNRNLTPGQRAKSIEFMTKQILRDWNLAPESATDAERNKAESAAKKRFRRQIKKDVIRVATFGFILEALWNLGAYLPYIIFGDDEDEKNKMWDDALTHAIFGSIEGLTGGDVMSSFGNMAVSGEWNFDQLSKDMPLTSDLGGIVKKFAGGKNTEAINDIINVAVQSGFGINPQTITDAVIAITDLCGDDPALSHEAAIFVMRFLHMPQSQLDKMYFDEIGLSGEEASKYTPEQLAARYAEYKVKRGTPLMPWAWGDEEQLDKYKKKATKLMKERLDAQGDADVNETYVDLEARYQTVSEKVKKAEALMETDYVAAAQAYAALQQDPDFTLYQSFGDLDTELGRISKMWLTSKIPEEAALIASTIPAYRAGMVKVLQAETEETQQSAMSGLTTLMNEFYTKYQAMRPQPQ